MGIIITPRRRSLLDSGIIIIALFGLYWFAASFFLAKKSLPNVSACDEAATLLQSVLGVTETQMARLYRHQILPQPVIPRKGCWMDRRVDSLVILLVDALRFDFCLYNLPKSVGTRLHDNGDSDGQAAKTNQTRLFRFVADPPTVTMQRLKALTTGGLPTFADISANFGGASVEEDSWVSLLLRTTNGRARGLVSSSTTTDNGDDATTNTGKAGFVGDDTWEDLYPGYFTESYPYPSFNTRDIDGVDNGCLKHIPHLMDHLLLLRHHDGGVSSYNDSDDDALEVIVVHFLGVDHVGHTYGPHNEHMDAKLKQMDDALSNVLDTIDKSDRCHAVLIFGDHGMTEDGNHGGGTDEEISAALFVHTSPACGDMSNAVSLERDMSSLWSANTPFSSIHQIDLVPTLSILLGLPIPFANLGSLVPSLVPGQSAAQTATALALNAAQVWRYLTLYSETANKLPDLPKLHQQLETAVSVYQEALDNDDDLMINDEAVVDRFDQASALFKLFLMQALELGQRVWTRFDTLGMIGGITLLAIAMLAYALPLLLASWSDLRLLLVRSRSSPTRTTQLRYWEVGLALFLMLFQCGLLTFSNSYILEEENSVMYAMAVLSILVAVRLQSDPTSSTMWKAVLLLPVASRVNELFVSGHGLDPSIRLHLAHSSIVFLSSLVVLAAFRWFLYQKQVTKSLMHAVVDCLTLLCLAGSWWEKRSPDPDRNGYILCRIALLLLFLGIPLSVSQALMDVGGESSKNKEAVFSRTENYMLTIISKVLIAIMAVTGPSTAATLVLYTFQATVVFLLSRAPGSMQVYSIVLAALWTLVTRHVFFATNHGCAFNRLQYSAAFIATTEFYFVTGGISLFLNTFGWEMVGFAFAWLLSQHPRRSNLWRIYTVYQLVEALTSCISVSLLRRHLMVWDIYAPHFLFAAIFTVLNGLSQLTITLLSYV